MAAGETPTLLGVPRNARRKECGRLDRGHSGVLARVLSGPRVEVAHHLPEILLSVSAEPEPRNLLLGDADRRKRHSFASSIGIVIGELRGV
jgi:hypothetical protein